MGLPRILAGLLALCVLVAGCTGLPESTGVSPGRGVDDKVGDLARVVAPPPAPGATPEQIVRGFLLAGAAFQEADGAGESVGNAYLSPGSVGRWRPTSQVVVFDRTTLVAVEVKDGRARIETIAVAVVDEAGRYRELPPGTVVRADLGVVEVAGEFRVSLPPEGFGLWLSTDDFGRLFAAHRLHYPVAGSRRLLPDVRWFPSGPRLVTALARAQLGEVPGYLRGTVDTGFPSTTRLAVDAVAVDNGVATVVLSTPASTADLAHRRAIWAQLAATLLGAPNVRAVSVEVQGSGQLPGPDVRGPVTALADLGFGLVPSGIVELGLQRRGEVLGWVDASHLDDGDPGPVPGRSPALPASLPAGYDMPAVAPGGTELAGVTGDGQQLVRWRDGERQAIPGLPHGLLRPSYDGTGRLWLSAAGPTGHIWTLDPASPAPQPVEVAWLDGRTLVSLAVSRDATRVAVVSRGTDGSVRLDVAGIVRAPSGRPSTLAAPWRQGEPLERIVDVSWLDDGTVIALGSVRGEDGLRPYPVTLGQGAGLRRIGVADPVQSLVATIAGARAVVSGNGARGVVVLTDLPSALVRVGSAWRRLGEATAFAVAPPALAAVAEPR